MMERGRRIAFDYGDARIGVAVSDPDSIGNGQKPFYIHCCDLSGD
jgi:RNase H-fold protein (predicted Holliday junction resolvase)